MNSVVFGYAVAVTAWCLAQTYLIAVLVRVGARNLARLHELELASGVRGWPTSGTKEEHGLDGRAKRDNIHPEEDR